MEIKRNALVMYTPRQMFELVNHVDDYPRFLPWCKSIQIIERTDEFVQARLDITWSGFHKHFTTRNQLTPYHSIDISLVQGPFRHLNGLWTFTPIEAHGCHVELSLEFEFAGSWFDKLFQPVFHSIANSLVDAFCKRAVDVYGQQ